MYILLQSNKCMYVCVYVMLLLICTSHHQHQTFMGRIVTVSSFNSVVTLSMNNQINFLVTTYNCPQHYADNYVRLFTTLCVFFSTIVRSDVIHEPGVARCYCNCQYYVAISRVTFKEAIKMSTGNTKYQGIEGVVCEFFLILLS